MNSVFVGLLVFPTLYILWYFNATPVSIVFDSASREYSDVCFYCKRVLCFVSCVFCNSEVQVLHRSIVSDNQIG